MKRPGTFRNPLKVILSRAASLLPSMEPDPEEKAKRRMMDGALLLDALQRFGAGVEDLTRVYLAGESRGRQGVKGETHRRTLNRTFETLDLNIFERDPNRRLQRVIDALNFVPAQLVRDGYVVHGFNPLRFTVSDEQEIDESKRAISFLVSEDTGIQIPVYGLQQRVAADFAQRRRVKESVRDADTGDAPSAPDQQ